MSYNQGLSLSSSKKGNRELIFISCSKAVLKYRMDTDRQKMLSKQSFKNAIRFDLIICLRAYGDIQT